MDGFYICLPKSHLLALCQSNFYALGVIVIFDAYYLHLSDNLDLVLEASSLCETSIGLEYFLPLILTAE